MEGIEKKRADKILDGREWKKIPVNLELMQVFGAQFENSHHVNLDQAADPFLFLRAEVHWSEASPRSTGYITREVNIHEIAFS